jgi:hypothetical protein
MGFTGVVEVFGPRSNKLIHAIGCHVLDGNLGAGNDCVGLVRHRARQCSASDLRTQGHGEEDGKCQSRARGKKRVALFEDVLVSMAASFKICCPFV